MSFLAFSAWSFSMSDSFVFNNAIRRPPKGKRRRVFVTGAAGRIGSYFAKHAAERYDLTLMIRPSHDDSKIAAFGNIVRAELGELDRLKSLLQGIDTVVHLAANPKPSAQWDSVLESNIIGLYTIFVAAKAAGCRRVVYASSIHAISGYPLERQVHPEDPVSPGDLYGVSKCFGEAMARYMSNEHGISAICIRIGSFQPIEKAREKHFHLMHTFVSHRDLFQLMVRSIDNEDLNFAIVNGLSDNHVFNRMDISTARELLGYEPQDNFAAENKVLSGIHLNENIAPHNDSLTGKSGIRKDL
jgi:nucleoside-diphosphate-sugar epimerase